MCGFLFLTFCYPPTQSHSKPSPRPWQGEASCHSLPLCPCCWISLDVAEEQRRANGKGWGREAKEAVERKITAEPRPPPNRRSSRCFWLSPELSCCFVALWTGSRRSITLTQDQRASREDQGGMFLPEEHLLNYLLDLDVSLLDTYVPSVFTKPKSL